MKRKIYKAPEKRVFTPEEISRLADEGEKLRDEIKKRLDKLNFIDPELWKLMVK